MNKEKLKEQKMLSEEELEKVNGGVNIEFNENSEEPKEQTPQFGFTMGYIHLEDQ